VVGKTLKGESRGLVFDTNHMICLDVSSVYWLHKHIACFVLTSSAINSWRNVHALGVGDTFKLIFVTALLVLDSSPITQKTAVACVI